MQCKNTQNQLRQALFSPKVEFSSIFGVPRGLLGRPGSLPEAFDFFFDSSLCLQTALDRTPGGPEEVPGHRQGPSRDHFRRILKPFWEDSGSILELEFQMDSYCDVVFFRDSFVKLIDLFVTPFVWPRVSD